MNAYSSRLTLVFLFSLTLAHYASAETVAETARKWGLIGSWAIDCAVPPDKGNGARLAYVIVPDGRVMHRRDFGDSKDENEVVGAEISADRMLNLRIFFAPLQQTREFGLVMERGGTTRAMYNRNQKNEYSIRDGKFIYSSGTTPSFSRCQ